MNPILGDQFAVVNRVKSFGAGLLLDNAHMNPSGPTRSCDDDHSYAHNAAKIGASFRTAGGSRQGADEILTFINRHVSLVFFFLLS
jgi:hypothetical protein